MARIGRRILLAGGAAWLAAAAGCRGSAPPPPSENDIAEFHAAVQDGDAEIVRRLLKAKPGLINARNSDGKTPLQVAKQRNNEELADLLRKQGGTE